MRRFSSYFPHMHLRGKSAHYTVHYPDGTQESLLDVPAYDFNWQTVYKYEDLKTLPAGSRVHLEVHWDNSAENAYNPDPNRDVVFGEPTTDEMMFGIVEYFYDGDAGPRKVSEEDRLKSMVASLPPDDVYAVDFRFGAQATPSALYLPRTGDGEWLFSYKGLQLKLPVSDVSWDADQFQFKMTLRFGEMGGDFNVRGNINNHGEITGKLTMEDGSASFLMSDFDGKRMAAINAH